MWAEIISNLSSYPSAVLTGVDAQGYPFSIRCIPQPDASQKKVTLEVPDGLPIEPGLASLMCHSHDEQLWDLKSFLVRGDLAKEGERWAFYPSKFVKSGATGGSVDQMRGLMEARRTAKKYLENRSLLRPKVPWEDLKRLRAEAKRN